MEASYEFSLPEGIFIDSEGTEEALSDGDSGVLITPMSREVVDGLKADLRRMALLWWRVELLEVLRAQIFLQEEFQRRLA